MQGLQKPVLYLFNPKREEELPFDMDDQIYVSHTNKESLIKGLEKEESLFIEKVRLSSGFESAQKEIIRGKVNKLGSNAKYLLKRIVLEGHFVFRVDITNTIAEWVKNSLKFDQNIIKELENERFIVSKTTSGGTRTLEIKKFNEPFRKYLEEILWE